MNKLFRYSHKVTAWGSLAIATDKQYEEAVEKPIIAIVASAKPKLFKSKIELLSVAEYKYIVFFLIPMFNYQFLTQNFIYVVLVFFRLCSDFNYSIFEGVI